MIDEYEFRRQRGLLMQQRFRSWRIWLAALVGLLAFAVQLATFVYLVTSTH